jgi:hypothetical protein
MKKTLYVLSCHRGRIGLLFTLYAEDKKTASARACSEGALREKLILFLWRFPP